MAPIGTDHCSVVDQLNRQFVMSAGTSAIVRIQGAVRLDWLSEPQPDLALLAARDDFYRHAHPLPADVLLLIEVSDSTLHERARRYAAGRAARCNCRSDWKRADRLVCRRRQRQRQRHSQPPSFAICEPDLAAMGFSNLARQCQAETGSCAFGRIERQQRLHQY